MPSIATLNNKNIYSLIIKLQDSKKCNSQQKIELRRILSKDKLDHNERLWVKKTYLDIFSPTSDQRDEQIVNCHHHANYA